MQLMVDSPYKSAVSAHLGPRLSSLSAAPQIVQFSAMEKPESNEEVTALIKAIHEDRQAAKDKEKRDSWTKYVSLMIVVLAVVTAYGSLKAGGYGSRVLLNQAKAHEAERDEAAKHGPPLGSGIAALQIAIALASVCLITKRKSLWAAAGALGAGGLGYLVYGLFLV